MIGPLTFITENTSYSFTPQEMAKLIKIFKDFVSDE
jgi:hypothetical protein